MEGSSHTLSWTRKANEAEGNNFLKAMFNRYSLEFILEFFFLVVVEPTALAMPNIGSLCQ